MREVAIRHGSDEATRRRGGKARRQGDEVTRRRGDETRRRDGGDAQANDDQNGIEQTTAPPGDPTQTTRECLKRWRVRLEEDFATIQL